MDPVQPYSRGHIDYSESSRKGKTSERDTESSTTNYTATEFLSGRIVMPYRHSGKVTGRHNESSTTNYTAARFWSGHIGMPV